MQMFREPLFDSRVKLAQAPAFGSEEHFRSRRFRLVGLPLRSGQLPLSVRSRIDPVVVPSGRIDAVIMSVADRSRGDRANLRCGASLTRRSRQCLPQGLKEGFHVIDFSQNLRITL